MKKRFFAIFIAVVTTITMLTGCGKTEEKKAPETASGTETQTEPEKQEADPAKEEKKRSL